MQTETRSTTVPDQARLAQVLPNLSSHSLISIVNLCNAGCEVTFNKIGCTIKYRGRTILCGRKCTKTGLWMIPLYDNSGTQPTLPIMKPTPTPTQQHIANIMHVRDTSPPSKYAKFIHQSLGSPPVATLLHAITHNVELQTIPGLTMTLITKHLGHTPATDKGHLHRVRQHVASPHNNHQEIVLVV
jgi:hypothetical protein